MRNLLILVLVFWLSGFSNAAASNSSAQANRESSSSSRQAPATTATIGESADATVAEAHKKLEHGETQEAIAMLEKLAAAGGPSAKGVQHELGIAYYRTGKLLSAEKAFALALQEDPNDLEAIQMRGLTLYRIGRPGDAIPYLERVRQWTPNANADANYVLGLCYINANRFDDARQAFANQFSVPAESGTAYLLLGKMLMHADLPEAAAEAAKKALALSPQLPLAHFMLGEFYLFKSQTDQALREFEQERSINPVNFAVYDRLGDVYTRVGKYQEAQESLAKAISLDQSNTGPFIQMGKVLLRRGDPETSLLYLQHAEKMDPQNYTTHALLSQAYRSLGREEEAGKESGLAQQIHSSNEVKLEDVR